MKSLAELKREAKTGKLYGEMVYWFGDVIPERLQGKRQIVDSNTVAIFFLTKDGRKSELRFDAASLVEYDGDTLTIYDAGLRELNADEQKIMNEWEAIASTEEYKHQAEIDAYTDGSSTFWQKKAFFENRDHAYMLGYETQRGKRYIYGEQKIRDNAIKGKMLMQYAISHQ